MNYERTITLLPDALELIHMTVSWSQVTYNDIRTQHESHAMCESISKQPDDGKRWAYGKA